MEQLRKHNSYYESDYPTYHFQSPTEPRNSRLIEGSPLAQLVYGLNLPMV